MSVLAELKRRNVFRVAAAYVVMSWLILQIVAVITPFVVLPAWFGGFVLTLLIAGFPVACLLAWAFELTPAGVKRAGLEPALGTQPTGALDWILLVALVVVISLVGYQQFMGPTDRSVPDAADPTASAAPAEGELTAIAVLPFTDMSAERDQEYFSDGISEEIINVLVKVPALRVVGRTSAFQFKGENRDLRGIGKLLNATHLIEAQK